MHAGIIHRYRDGTWQIGDMRLKKGDVLPRSLVMDKYLFYFTTSIRMEEWKEILGERDEFFGIEPGNVMGVRIFLPGTDKIKSGYMTFMNPKLWKISKVETGSVSALDSALFRKYALFAYHGAPKIGSSLAGTAMSWYTKKYNNKTVDDIEYPPFIRLAPRWRSIAHSAFHGGPIACLRGGSKNAVEIDISGAYLNALTKDIPIIDSTSQYLYFPDISWRALREQFGFVEATVTVPEKLKYGLPPLPISTPNGIKYPIGLFRGCWTIMQLREAEEHYDVVVNYIHQHAVAPRKMPLFKALAVEWSRIPKAVSKPLYTRFWGKFGFKGGYVGRISDDPIEQGIPKDHYWWLDERIDQLTEDVELFYRPDISAMIASYNHIAVQRALRMLDPKSIIAVHVDAIWTDDIEGAKRVCEEIKPCPDTNTGNWKKKKEGKIRFWGCGVYDHDGKIGCSGYSIEARGAPTHEILNNWVKTNIYRAETEKNRIWVDDVSAAVSRDAFSTSSRLKQNITYPTTDGLLIQSPRFTIKGWIR